MYKRALKKIKRFMVFEGLSLTEAFQRAMECRECKEVLSRIPIMYVVKDIEKVTTKEEIFA